MPPKVKRGNQMSDRAMLSCEDDYLTPPEPKNKEDDPLYWESQEYNSDDRVD